MNEIIELKRKFQQLTIESDPLESVVKKVFICQFEALIIAKNKRESSPDLKLNIPHIHIAQEVIDFQRNYLYSPMASIKQQMQQNNVHSFSIRCYELVPYYNYLLKNNDEEKLEIGK